MRRTITAAATLAAASATAEPTHIDLRALSRGAKFIGTSMGGVRFTLEDVQTGEVLTTGVATGSTGDTEALMDAPRNSPVAGEGASVWTATLDIDEPRLVRAVAYGPLAQPQSARRGTAEQWIVPGRDLTGGDGWVIEIPGLVVDTLAPAAHTVLDAEADAVEVTANVMMMCGCPIEPDGVWDAADFQVVARVSHNGELQRTVPLEPTDKPSHFAAEIAVDVPGDYGLTVVAHQPSNGNTGLDRTTFVLPRE